MLPYVFYNVLHLLGVLLVFTSYGALIARTWTGSTHTGVRKFGAISSGIGLLFLLISGFGMVPVWGFAGWVWVKIIVWVILGALLAAINRKAVAAPVLFWITVGMGFVAVLAVYLKPF